MPVSVTVLGAGDAFASKGWFQAGYVIKADGLQVLMEAGPTLLASMKRVGLTPAALDVVLVSHLHGDHFGGLPFLILEYLYESPRHRKLTLAGPPHLEERTWALFRTHVSRKRRFRNHAPPRVRGARARAAPFGQRGVASPNHQDPAHNQGHFAGFQG